MKGDDGCYLIVKSGASSFYFITFKKIQTTQPLKRRTKNRQKVKDTIKNNKARTKKMVNFRTSSFRVSSMVMLLHLRGTISTNSGSQADSVFGDGCTSNTPVFEAFEYPKFGNVNDTGVDEKYRTCSGSEFYFWNFPVDIRSANGTLHENVSCKEAIRKRKDNSDFGNETIPGSANPDCCDAWRMGDDMVFEAEVRRAVTVNFTIDDQYPGHQQEFKELCEQLWACTSYQKMFSVHECKASGHVGCDDYSYSSLCFAGAYDSHNDKEMRRRESFIVQSCFGASDPQ